MGKKNNNSEQKYIVHIDLGGSKISALAGIVEENGALTVLGEEKQLCDDIKSGIIEKVSNAAFNISGLTKLLQNSLHSEKIEIVSISVNPKSMKHVFRTVNRPIERQITQEFLNKVKNELKASINSDKIYIYDIQELEYFIDGKPTENPIGIKGSNIRIDYKIVIGNIQVQESIERCFHRTTLKVDYIHLGIDALATVLLEENDIQNGCALIAFGATTTTLAIYNEGKLQETFVVPFGGLNITKDIQELGIRIENAELLKCRKGNALESFVTEPVNVKIPAEDPEKAPIVISSKFLATIIEARLSEIMEPLFDIINQITYRLQNGIVITGGACKLQNLKEFITEKTGFQVREGNHTEWLSENTNEKFFHPEYSQAIGAMLHTHDLNVLKKEREAAIEPKINKGGIIGKVGKMLNNSAQKLFEYDEIEEQNEK